MGVSWIVDEVWTNLQVDLYHVVSRAMVPSSIVKSPFGDEDVNLEANCSQEGGYDGGPSMAKRGLLRAWTRRFQVRSFEDL